MIPRRWINILPSEANLIENPSDALLNNDSLINRWESEFAEYFGRKHAVAMPSGRVGFNLILKYFMSNKDLKAGDEVLVPALTLKAIVNIITSAGLKPVFVDIEPNTLNISINDLKNKITEKTKVILALHTFGNPCCIKQISEIAKEHNLILIEDCAHACGARVKEKIKVETNEQETEKDIEKMVGCYGQASFFSFDVNKVLNTFGGGMVITDDSKIYKFIKEFTESLKKDPQVVRRKLNSIKFEQYLYKSTLIYPLLYLRTYKPIMKIFEYTYRRLQSVPPENIKFNPIQASIGIEKLSSLHSKVQQRLELAKTYMKNLTDKVKVPYIHPNSIPSYYMYVVILPCPAKKIVRKLLYHGIDSAFENEIIDLVVPHEKDKSCPNAGYVYHRLIALPFYDTIDEGKIERVCHYLEVALK